MFILLQDNNICVSLVQIYLLISILTLDPFCVFVCVFSAKKTNDKTRFVPSLGVGETSPPPIEPPGVVGDEPPCFPCCSVAAKQTARISSLKIGRFFSPKRTWIIWTNHQFSGFLLLVSRRVGPNEILWFYLWNQKNPKRCRFWGGSVSYCWGSWMNNAVPLKIAAFQFPVWRKYDWVLPDPTNQYCTISHLLVSMPYIPKHVPLIRHCMIIPKMPIAMDIPICLLQKNNSCLRFSEQTRETLLKSGQTLSPMMPNIDLCRLSKLRQPSLEKIEIMVKRGQPLIWEDEKLTLQGTSRSKENLSTQKCQTVGSWRVIQTDRWMLMIDLMCFFPSSDRSFKVLYPGTRRMAGLLSQQILRRPK